MDKSYIYIILFCSLVICNSCGLQQKIEDVEYDVVWNSDRPYQVHVDARIPGFKKAALKWSRASFVRVDHRRGWIEWLSPVCREDTSKRFCGMMNDNAPVKYAYSFLYSDLNDYEYFRSSRADNNHLFLQSVDLFCLPVVRDLNDIRFSVRFHFPDQYPIYTPWPLKNTQYEINFSDLTESFIVAGNFRETAFRSDDLQTQVVIDNRIAADGDPMIVDTIKKSCVQLNKVLYTEVLDKVLIIIGPLQGTNSYAMRRGRSVFAGWPLTQDFSQTVREKLVHEMVHVFVRIDDDATWFEEGVVEYISLLTMVRSQMISKDDFFNSLSEKIIQIKNNPYQGSLKEAMSGRGGQQARNYLYQMGTLGAFALDVKIRTILSGERLESFIKFSEIESGKTEIKAADLKKHLSNFGAPAAMAAIDQFMSGTVPVEEYLAAAGLELKENGFTLIGVFQPESGTYSQILPGDHLRSIDFQFLDKHELNQYLEDRLDQIVSAQIERDGDVKEVKQRVVRKYVISPKNYQSGTLWLKILNDY